MGFIDSASGNSIWRGVDYCNEKKVISYVKVDDFEYDGIVSGSNNNQYNVHIVVI